MAAQAPVCHMTEVEADVSSLFGVYLTAWDNVTKRTVANCWHNMWIFTPHGPHRKLLVEATDEAPSFCSDPDVEGVVEGLDKAIGVLAAIAPGRLMRAQEMLDNNSGEMEGTLPDKEVMEQVLRDQWAEEAEQNGEEAEEDFDEDEPEPIITATEIKGYLQCCEPVAGGGGMTVGVGSHHAGVRIESY
ncbi:hypothetical protein FRC01_006316 [Tulasnella sp. 417]|nr:hypothetical protein FRC01_006316 [Tulasnella sp. 417]